MKKKNRKNMQVNKKLTMPARSVYKELSEVVLEYKMKFPSLLKSAKKIMQKREKHYNSLIKPLLTNTGLWSKSFDPIALPGNYFTQVSDLAFRQFVHMPVVLPASCCSR